MLGKTEKHAPSAVEGTERTETVGRTFHLWIDEIPRPGWVNMAIDMALLDRAEQGESWLRLYSWEPHCLSFGRHEPATRRYDAARIAQWRLDAVRRPTGGRAVWHARELTYAVTAPSRRFGALQAAYEEIHAMLADALRALGILASMAPRARPAALDAGACFAQAAGGEVVVDGRKVIGSAQLRQAAALLQHGSILLEDDQRMVLRLMRGEVPSTAEESEATRLRGLGGRYLSPFQVARAVARTAAARWAGVWRRISDPDPILASAARYFPQFTSSAWTWAR
jgi:lipoate-protein ligase A